jgi:protein SCO1/2
VIRRSLVLGMIAALVSGAIEAAPKPDALPTIGAAPAFTLTAQDERRVSLADLRGKVVVLTFIYTTCVDTCPLLTAKLAALQGRLGADFVQRVFFVAITVDPERDTPAVLKGYGTAHGARFDGWAFMTGSPAEIREVAKRYGIFYKKTPRGDIDHTFLTSLIDARGALRVQYLGVRFEITELLNDVRSLVAETAKR